MCFMLLYLECSCNTTNPMYGTWNSAGGSVTGLLTVMYGRGTRSRPGSGRIVNVYSKRKSEVRLSEFFLFLFLFTD